MVKVIAKKIIGKFIVILPEITDESDDYNSIEQLLSEARALRNE